MLDFIKKGRMEKAGEGTFLSFFFLIFQPHCGSCGILVPPPAIEPHPCIGRQSLHQTTSQVPEKEHFYKLLKRRFREGQAASAKVRE